jgi:hypothetical protein
MFCSDYAALYEPVSINYGMVYPPAILVFIMTLVYAVMSPLILVFGAIYFAAACECQCAFLFAVHS